MVEHGDSGSRAAAPVARSILDQYLLGAQAVQFELDAETQMLMEGDPAAVPGHVDTATERPQ